MAFFTELFSRPRPKEMARYQAALAVLNSMSNTDRADIGIKRRISPASHARCRPAERASPAGQPRPKKTPLPSGAPLCRRMS